MVRACSNVGSSNPVYSRFFLLTLHNWESRDGCSRLQPTQTLVHDLGLEESTPAALVGEYHRDGSRARSEDGGTGPLENKDLLGNESPLENVGSRLGTRVDMPR